MKVIIAGPRDYEDYETVVNAIGLSGFDVTEVVSGHCLTGVDRLGERWARENGVVVSLFPAEWAILGRLAGPVRNRKMAGYADAAVVIWDGVSRGSKNMIDEAERAGKPVYVHRVRPCGKIVDGVEPC